MCCCAEYSALKKECASSAEQVGWISLDSTVSSKSLLENFQKFLAYCILIYSRTSVDCEQSRSRTGSGQRQTDSFSNSECLPGRGIIQDEGDILLQRSGRRQRTLRIKNGQEMLLFSIRGCDSTHILWSSLLCITSVNLLCNLTHWWYCLARSAMTSFGTFAHFASL